MGKLKITSLPESVLHLVFARLPFTSFITCRAVCKEWQAILCHSTLLRSWVQLHTHYVSIHAQPQQERKHKNNSPFLIIYENPFPSSQLISRPQIFDNVRRLVYVYSPLTRRAYPFSTDMIGDHARLVGIAEGDANKPFTVVVAAVKRTQFALADIYGNAKNSWACKFYHFSPFGANIATGSVFFKGVFFLLSISEIIAFDTRAEIPRIKNVSLPLPREQIVWRRLNRWKSYFILTSTFVQMKKKGFNLKGMDVHRFDICEWQIWAKDHTPADIPFWEQIMNNHNAANNPNPANNPNAANNANAENNANASNSLIWEQIAKMPSDVCGSFNDNSSGLSSYLVWESEVVGDYLFCKAQGSKEMITFDLKTRLWDFVANCGEIEDKVMDGLL